MDKVIRDGKVAVLYSPGFGAGWSTWGGSDVVLFHPALVAWVEGGKKEPIGQLMARELPDEKMYLGGAEDLEIEWVDEGTNFRIDEYDGAESVVTEGPGYWVRA